MREWSGSKLKICIFENIAESVRDENDPLEFLTECPPKNNVAVPFDYNPNLYNYKSNTAQLISH